MLIATDLSTSERLVRYAAHYGPVNSLAVTRAGTSAGRELLLTGGDDGVARVWDPAREGKDPVVELDDGLGGVVTAVEWSADGSAAFVGGVDNEIKVSTEDWVPACGTDGFAGLGSSETRGPVHAQGAHRYRGSSISISCDGTDTCADRLVGALAQWPLFALVRVRLDLHHPRRPPVLCGPNKSVPDAASKSLTRLLASVLTRRRAPRLGSSKF